MRRARVRRRRIANRRRRAERYALARRLVSPSFALLGGVSTLLYYGLRLESSWAESFSTGASVAFLTFLALEIPNMVFADMFVRGERAERVAAQAQATAAEARAVAAETRAEMAEMWRMQAETAEARAKAAQEWAEAAQQRSEAAHERSEAAHERAEAAHRRSERMMAALIEALDDGNGGVDREALRRLLDELR